MSTIVYTYPVSITDTSIPITPRDELITGANDGVRFLFDLANEYSYVSGTPSNGKAVRDLADISSAGSIANPDASVVAGGGGIDFTSISSGNKGIKLPAAVLDDLFEDQEYLVCSYVKMPLLADWPAVSSGLSGTWITATDGTSSYVDSPELALVCCSLTQVGGVTMRRQTAINVHAALSLTGCTIHAGLLTQISFWRTASATGFRFKSAGGTSVVTGAAGAKNAADFSAKTLNFGPFGSFGYGASVANWKNGQRLYRGFVENLHRSLRDPVTVLNADYDRVIARGVFT